jgi:hypothetical protein
MQQFQRLFHHICIGFKHSLPRPIKTDTFLVFMTLLEILSPLIFVEHYEYSVLMFNRKSNPRLQLIAGKDFSTNEEGAKTQN